MVGGVAVSQLRPRPTLTPRTFSNTLATHALQPLLGGGGKSIGFRSCTPIRGEILPSAISDADIEARAQTGTGKTAACLLTATTRLLRAPPRQHNARLCQHVVPRANTNLPHQSNRPRCARAQCAHPPPSTITTSPPDVPLWHAHSPMCASLRQAVDSSRGNATTYALTRSISSAVLRPILCMTWASPPMAAVPCAALQPANTVRPPCPETIMGYRNGAVSAAAHTSLFDNRARVSEDNRSYEPS